MKWRRPPPVRLTDVLPELQQQLLLARQINETLQAELDKLYGWLEDHDVDVPFHRGEA